MDVTYCFARLNLLANYTDKGEFLIQTMTGGSSTHYRNYEWSFTDIAYIKHLDEDFITGFLVKYEKQGENEVVDDLSNTVGLTEVPNLIAGKSRFFLHIKSGLIAYNTQGSIISQDSFQNRFSEIIEEHNQGLFIEAIMYTIQEDIDFTETFYQFKYLYKIHISLHPSNPNFRSRWKDYDERIKALGDTQYTEIHETKKDKGTIKPDAEIQDKTVMAQDGYGVVTATGITPGGEQITVSTANNPSTTQAPGNEEKPVYILPALWPKIVSIFDRFKNNERENKNTGDS